MTGSSERIRDKIVNDNGDLIDIISGRLYERALLFFYYKIAREKLVRHEFFSPLFARKKRRELAGVRG